jgi:1-acyl-sn-glycerol-3-phosphate acyltransferase
MKTLISIYCWVTGILYFLSLCFLSLILTLFIPHEKLDPFIKWGCRVLFKLLRIKVTVEGSEHIKRGKTYLFMANHVSGFDVPLLQGFIPVFVRGIEAKHHFKVPIFGWLLRRVGNIPMDRKNIHASIRSIGKASSRLSDQKSIVILPEGHRTLDGNLMPFKRLPFFLAKKAGVDIIPMGLSGLFTMNRKGSWHIQPTELKIKFGSPIPVQDIERLSVDDLSLVTKNHIEALIEYA